MTVTLPSLSAGSAGSAYSAAVVNAAITQQKTNIENVINGLQGIDALLWNNSTATLASDTLSLTAKPRVLVIDTEAAAATDNLSTISNGTAYTTLLLKAANAGRVITVKHNVGNIKLNGAADIVLSSAAWLLLFYDGTQWSDTFVPASIITQVCNARLTLTSGLAVDPNAILSAGTIYITPYLGNRMALYNGSSWAQYTFSEITMSLAGLAANKNYDVFVYDNGSGTVIAENVVWTNDSTRATGLVLQNGVYVKTGTLTKRYIGTFRTTGTIGDCAKSPGNYLVWNYYNRVRSEIIVVDTTDSWTYATATWRAWNNSNANRINFVIGVAEDEVSLTFIENTSSSAGSGQLGIGLDSTSAPTGLYVRAGVTSFNTTVASYNAVPAAGFHFLQLLEYATAATTTFYGDNAGTQSAGASGHLAA